MPPHSANPHTEGKSATGAPRLGRAGQEETAAEPPRLMILLAVCGLGISAIITQLTLMRELLSAFGGNEMVLGIVLGNWLLLTGLGSYLGRTAARLKRPVNFLLAAQILVAVLPIASVFALRALRNVVFVRGAMVGITETVASCFVLLLPYCLISGYLLTLTCGLLARRAGPESIGQVYFLDNIGDILGGVAFTFVLVRLFDHFGILYLPALLNLALAMALAAKTRNRPFLALAGTILVAGAAVAFSVDVEGAATRLEYSGRNVVYRGNSPYGSLVVTASAGQHNFIANGVPIFSTHDVEQVEQAVHYAMVQRPGARKVLLISGGVSGTPKEILKYGPARVDYVELDPLIVQVGRRYLPEALADERIRVITTDGRAWVKRTDGRYDVIIADLPDPSTSQLNRFYTVEFFGEVKKILAPDGVLSISLGHYENYVSEELARLIAVAHRTLGEVFGNIMIVPSGSIFFLASDGRLTEDIAGRIEQLGIMTQFVNRHYLQAAMSPDRIADVRRAVSPDAPVNRDFSPVLYYYHLLHWLSRFGFKLGLLEVGLTAILVAYLLRMRPVGLAIFTTGFTASGLVMVLLLAFQIIYGSVYHRVGLIVTAFMIGLAAGSFTMNRMLSRRGRKDLAKLEGAIAIYAALLPAGLIGLGQAGGPAARILAEPAIAALTFVLAMLVGMEFPLAGKVQFAGITTTAAQIYTADFVGACLGAMLASTFLIPVIGVVWLCLLMAGINCISGAVVWLSEST